MKKEIENRLIKFSVRNFELTDNLKKKEYAVILAKQLLRSSSSAALNYGEAQGAETSKDFIHKIGIVIKELRESYVNLRIIKESRICNNEIEVEALISENNELISIFFATLKTAKKNQQGE
jgi:four helix bundle protein